MVRWSCCARSTIKENASHVSSVSFFTIALYAESNGIFFQGQFEAWVTLDGPDGARRESQRAREAGDVLDCV